MKALELWGGHECTVNRVRNRYMDQSVLSGHDERLSDLEVFADLGLKALRYPVLWEKVSPHALDARDFSRSDRQLEELRRLGMKPIVGLCHHGAGPAYTNLLDDAGFASGLAQHARATAQRYPWVSDWTPVNEPLTTARFSALYGIWHPHTRSEGAFWRALLNEIDATRLAMKEIRRITPDARLIQTDDLGFCHATPAMQEQAAYENERRWITWDLLCGAVTPGHPLWSRIAAWGLADRLRAIADAPCPPDVIGVNHYLSSERLLDERVHLYPASVRGGDGPAPYVNIEAVRTVAEGARGLAPLLAEAWARYGRPIAITECHNGCTREEQVRWFYETWRTAEVARREGAEIEAVTAWALLGSVDWNRLLAEESGHYEVGVFDLRLGSPRPTAMVPLLQALSAGRSPDLPVLEGRGWWRREDRLLAQVYGERAPPEVPASTTRQPLLLVAPANDRLEAILTACRRRDLEVEWLELRGTDLTVGTELERVIELETPWAVLGVGDLSRATIEASIAARSIERAFWIDTHPSGGCDTGALTVIGGEALTERQFSCFADEVLTSLEAGAPFTASSTTLAPCAYLPDVVDCVLDLVIDAHRGSVVLAGASQVTWAEFAVILAAEAQLDRFLIRPAAVPRLARTAAEPLGPTLLLPELTTAVRRIIAQRELSELGRTSAVTREAGPHRQAAE